MRDWIQVVVIGTAVAMVALFVVGPYRVNGNSMEPNFHHGDLLIIDKLSLRVRDPQPGEVVVFTAPGDSDLIKRVIREDTPGQLWIEGDNKESSLDSREFGPIPKKAIIGRVWFRLW